MALTALTAACGSGSSKSAAPGSNPYDRPGAPVSSADVGSGSVRSDPVVAAAGDIACAPDDGSFNRGFGSSGACQEAATAKLLDQIQPDAVLALGDLQYESGTPDAFASSYDTTWGKWKAKTYPAPGNHEFNSANAYGYFGYWGAAAGEKGKGWYSFELGAWHVIALDSNCSKVGCAVDSDQGRWLAADLAAHPAQCTLAFWHHPRYSSGLHGDDTAVEPFWQLLSAAHADLVLVGHDHDYERFAVQRGIREIVAGTGGRSLYFFRSQLDAGSEVRDSVTFGVLQLTLHPTSYDWKFVPIAGKTFTDSGTQNCT